MDYVITEISTIQAADGEFAKKVQFPWGAECVRGEGFKEGAGAFRSRLFHGIPLLQNRKCDRERCLAKKRPRFAPRQNGVPLRRGGILLKLALQFLASGELHGLGSLDLNLFAGLRIHANPGLAADNLKCAEADELDALTFLERSCDGVDDRGDRLFSGSFAGFFAQGFLNVGYELCLVHGWMDRVLVCIDRVSGAGIPATAARVCQSGLLKSMGFANFSTRNPCVYAGSRLLSLGSVAER